jgi:hypothetical protein
LCTSARRRSTSTSTPSRSSSTTWCWASSGSLRWARYSGISRTTPWRSCMRAGAFSGTVPTRRRASLLQHSGPEGELMTELLERFAELFAEPQGLSP